MIDPTFPQQDLIWIRDPETKYWQVVRTKGPTSSLNACGILTPKRLGSTLGSSCSWATVPIEWWNSYRGPQESYYILNPQVTLWHLLQFDILFISEHDIVSIHPRT